MKQPIIGAWIVAAACATPAAAQTTDETPGRIGRMLQWVETTMNVDGTNAGVRPELGVSIVGGGPAGGAGYRLPLFDQKLTIDASAVLSIRGYKDVQTRVELPRLASGRVAIGADVRFQDGTQINYFGIGAGSSEDAQSNYRLQYLDTGGYASVRLTPAMWITGRAGVMNGATVAGGTSSVVPPIDARFENVDAPGLGARPDFTHADIALEIDTRDRPGYPSSGGRYRAGYAAYHDRSDARYSFQRVEAEAAQYIPIGDRSVAALHARLDTSQTADGHEVPFYLLPTLGSGQSLRGFDDYRFRDRNAFLGSGEVRTRLAAMFDVAAFVDSGTVAPTVGALASQHLFTDYGLGLRMHSASRLIARIDVARSTEGMHAIVSFSPSMAFSKRIVAPFIP